MLTLNVITLNDSQRISGSMNGERFNVKFSEKLYKKLLEYKDKLASAETVEIYQDLTQKVFNKLNKVTADKIVEVCTDLYKDEEHGTYHVMTDSIISKHAVPELLVDMIVESIDKGIDATPVIKAWTRFLRNPNFTAEKGERFAKYITSIIVDGDLVEKLVNEEGYTQEKAAALAAYSDVGISEEGLIVAKKYAKLLTEGWRMDQKNNVPVRVDLYEKTPDTVDKISGEVTNGEVVLPKFNEDLYFEPALMGTGGNEFSCGDYVGHVIRVGAEHSLESWDMVNTNDNSCCVKGLHVGGWKYVSSYRGNNYALLDCFIDPMDIGAIISIEDGDGAIRVKSYFVYDYNKGRNKSMFHSSHYAAIKDNEWESYKAEAIKNSNEIAVKITESANSLGL